MAHICVIDDNEILRETLKTTLEREDHTVTTFGDPVEALAAVKGGKFDLIASDLKMPRMDGMTLIRELRSAGIEAPVVVMTAFATVSTAVEAIRLGAFDYIQKPFEADAFVVTVERALEHARLRTENEALRTFVSDTHPTRELIGSSRVMTTLRDQLAKVGAGNATVLITGESGTGKELAAAYIHHHSPRAGKPMLCLNCAALSANLLESELFGHERGAFTGADRTRKGRFELADGGTLLLDEITEMPMPLQAKLLRVLQEGQFERVGSSTTRRVDVRVVAATNRDIERCVAENNFRSDLYYRLNVLPVKMPSLRERTEDVPELVAHFLRQTTVAGAEPPKIDPQALLALKEYMWPGNVRELENICVRAAALCRGGIITADLIRPWLTGQATSFVDGFGALRPGHMLQDMERQLIERTLAHFNGHRAKSAKALGMGLRTLGMKLKQWREEAQAQQQQHQTQSPRTAERISERVLEPVGR